MFSPGWGGMGMPIGRLRGSGVNSSSLSEELDFEIGGACGEVDAGFGGGGFETDGLGGCRVG